MAHDPSTPTPPLDPGPLLEEASWLRGLARELVGAHDPNAADELVQDTMLARLAGPAPARERERAWLRQVATNLERQSFRRRTARRRRERAAARPESIAATDQVVVKAQTHRLLVDAVLELDEPFRSTLLRRYFDDLDASAIAAADGVAIATVRTRIHRGLARLREELTRRHGGRDDWLAGVAVLAAPSAAMAGATATNYTLGLTTSWLVMQKTLLAVAALVLSIVAWSLFVDRGPNESRVGLGVAEQASRETVAATPAAGAKPGSPATSTREEVSARTRETIHEVRPAGGTIAVQVTGPGRQRASRAVAFQPPSYPQDFHHSARPDDVVAPLIESRATLTGLVDGAWWVAVLEGDRILSQKSIDNVRANETTTLRFPLGRAAIEGLIYGPDGRPQAGLLVRCSLLERGAYRSDTKTDARGHFRFDAVPQGTAWIGVYAEADFARPPRFMREFPIREDRTYRINFGTAQPSALWRGTVRNRLGQQVPGQTADFRRGQLRLESAQGERRIVPLRPDGSFEVALSPGLWKVRVRAPSQRGSTELAAPVEMGTTDLNRDLDMPWSRVEGRVVDLATGAAIRGQGVEEFRIELWSIPTKRPDGKKEGKSGLVGVHRADPRTGTFLFDAVAPDTTFELRCGAIGATAAFKLATYQYRLTVDLRGRRPR